MTQRHLFGNQAPPTEPTAPDRSIPAPIMGKAYTVPRSADRLANCFVVREHHERGGAPHRVVVRYRGGTIKTLTAEQWARLEASTHQEPDR